MTKSSKIVLDIVNIFSEQWRQILHATIETMGIKIAKRIWKHMVCMHASIFIINYLNKKTFLLPYQHSVIFLVHIK